MVYHMLEKMYNVVRQIMYIVGFNICTVRKSSCGKVMFSQASVILFRGGVSQLSLGQTPPWADIPPGQTAPSPEQTYPSPGQTSPSPGQTSPPWADTLLADTSPRADIPPRWPLQRTVRILLECILVTNIIEVYFCK